MPASSPVQRSVSISAEPSTVWQMVSQSEGFAKWLGAGSSIEATVGGGVKIVMPGGVAASGRVTAIDPGKRIAFTYGYDSGSPFPAGSTTVEIRLSPRPDGGTDVTLTHTNLPSEELGHAHAGGWRHCLSVLAHQSCFNQSPKVRASIDGYYAAWGKGDMKSITAALHGHVSPEVEFRDPHGVVIGVGELAAHILAVKQFMRGTVLEQDGEPSLCHSQAISKWVATSGGTQVARGQNVIDLTPDGLVRRITGHWMG